MVEPAAQTTAMMMMMEEEEELNYVAVNFKTKGGSPHEPDDLATIYDEVMTSEEQLGADVVKAEKPSSGRRRPQLHLLSAALGIVSAILVSVLIALCLHFEAVMSERRGENSNLTAQNLQLRWEKAELQRRVEQLSRDRDGLNWTIDVIMGYQDFPVETLCPQRACKACVDGWFLFQSACYRFSATEYSYHWRTWEGSREKCREEKADLVVIDSQEEQEFINNHTKEYHDDKHGYWIGLRMPGPVAPWMWVDGSNVTLNYWRTHQTSYRMSCALTLPHADPLANWHGTGCEMRNRWICETRALIKQS